MHVLMNVCFFHAALLLSEKETERAEGELGTMDGLSPRATHNGCQVETAAPQPFYHSALYTTQLSRRDCAPSHSAVK